MAWSPGSITLPGTPRCIIEMSRPLWDKTSPNVRDWHAGPQERTTLRWLVASGLPHRSMLSLRQAPRASASGRRGRFAFRHVPSRGGTQPGCQVRVAPRVAARPSACTAPAVRTRFGGTPARFVPAYRMDQGREDCHAWQMTTRPSGPVSMRIQFADRSSVRTTHEPKDLHYRSGPGGIGPRVSACHLPSGRVVEAGARSSIR